ncbi:hypothetical protein [Enterococcus plantarum]|uniref:hypothetical protein n=1 Tax=Enterococcus plantarum TaxID=1077675 RepID=UPI000DA85801|nr:hypothetical protein [Enterococcus plantarum]
MNFFRDRQHGIFFQDALDYFSERWKTDWIATKKDISEFTMRYEVRDTTTYEPKLIMVDEYTPKDYRMNFREILHLFKKKTTIHVIVQFFSTCIHYFFHATAFHYPYLHPAVIKRV